MRTKKSIRLGGDEGQDTTVLEMSVAQIPDALEVITACQASPESRQDLVAMASQVLKAEDGAARRLLHGMTDLGAKIDDVGGLALVDIVEAWVEVNQAFFDRLGTAVLKLSQTGSAEKTGKAA